MGGTKADLFAADLIYNWMSATIKAKSKRKALYCILSEQIFQDENRMKQNRDDRNCQMQFKVAGGELDVADDTRGEIHSCR